MKKFLKDKYNLIALFSVIGLVAFVWYGLSTQCANVVVYHYCSKDLR